MGGLVRVTSVMTPTVAVLTLTLTRTLTLTLILTLTLTFSQPSVKFSIESFYLS